MSELGSSNELNNSEDLMFIIKDLVKEVYALRTEIEKIKTLIDFEAYNNLVP